MSDDSALEAPTARFYLKGGRHVDTDAEIDSIDEVVTALAGPPRRVVFGDIFVYNHDVTAAELL